MWADKKLLGTKTGDEAVRLLYQGDSPIGFVANSEDVYLYVKNLQGDVTGIADKTGTLVVSYTYDAWGNILSQSGDAAIAKLNPITYRGYNYDTETGLYYLQSRYYNSDWGRFLNADNAVDTRDGIVSCNAFAYCGNNPIAYIDLTGSSKWTYLRWPGEIHRAVQVYISTKYGYLTERTIININNGKNIGRVDLLNSNTFEIWEIKPISYSASNSKSKNKSALKQLNKYLNGRWQSRTDRKLFPGGYIEPGMFPYGNYIVTYYPGEPGMIYYDFEYHWNPELAKVISEIGIVAYLALMIIVLIGSQGTVKLPDPPGLPA